MLTYEEFRADLERQKQEDARRIQEERAAAEQAWLAEQRAQQPQMTLAALAPSQVSALRPPINNFGGYENEARRLSQYDGPEQAYLPQSPQASSPQEQTSQISIRRPQETIPMREAFNPARYGFEGEQMRMPEGANPDRQINPQEYFRKGGEYWGDIPQSVVLSPRTDVAPAPPQSKVDPRQEMIDSLMGGVIGPGGRLDEAATARNRQVALKMMEDLAKTKSGAAKEASEALKREAEIKKLDAETQKLGRGEPTKADWGTVESGGKIYQINKNTGEMRPATIAGEQLAGKEGKGDKAMQGIGDVISQAEAILTGKVVGQKALPTESPIGAGYDYVASLVGATPAGASEADQLKVLGGALTSKMPRMEGPQSEYDVKLYQEMAGRVGDPSVPRERRIAALKQVKDLWAKYDKSGTLPTDNQPQLDQRKLIGKTPDGKPVYQTPDGKKWVD